jgi:hypothetical protein
MDYTHVLPPYVSEAPAIELVKEALKGNVPFKSHCSFDIVGSQTVVLGEEVLSVHSDVFLSFEGRRVT